MLGTTALLQIAIVLSTSTMASNAPDDELEIYVSEPGGVPPLDSPMLYLGPPVYVDREELEELGLLALLLPLHTRRRRMGKTPAHPKAKNHLLERRDPGRDHRAPVAPAPSQEGSTQSRAPP